jgi:hypothetical protein
VVRADEEAMYRENGYRSVLVLPKRINGLSETRQWLLENGERIAIHADDDIRSYNFKPRENRGGLRRASPAEVEDAYAWLDKNARSGKVSGLSPRWNAGVSSKFESPPYGFPHGLFALDSNVVNRLRARFDRVEYFQDKDLILQLLTRGVETLVSFRWSCNFGADNAAGGCEAHGRSLESKLSAARRLAVLHPGICALPVVKNGYVRTPTKWKLAAEIGRKLNKIVR